MNQRLLCAVLLCLAALPSSAAWRAGAETVKLVVKKHSGAAAPARGVDHSAVTRLGGRVVSDRADAIIIEVPRTAADALGNAIGRNAQSVVVREDLDVVKFAAFPVDARRGAPVYPPDWRSDRSAATTGRDAFVIQFAAAPRAEWLDAVRNAGLKIIDYVPENAYVVFGTEDAVRKIEAALPVQFAERHQPVHRIAAAVRDTAEPFVDITVVLADVPEAAEALAFLGESSMRELGPVIPAGDRTIHRVSFSGPSLRDLARMPGVIWIEKAPQYALSGERDAYLVAGDSLVTWSGNLLRPAAPTAYRTWITNKGVGNYTAAVKVGLIDTGLDRGSTTDIHPDFTYNTRAFVEFADYTSTNAGTFDDCLGHGTMIGGIVAGNAGALGATSTRDIGASYGNYNYLMGLGVAPALPLVAGKISVGNRLLPDPWTQVYADLASRGVSIVNNSWNDYGNPGVYTADTQTLDRVVRHVDGTDSSGPMAIYFSAGNTDQFGGMQAGATQVAAPATGKNVIAVGGTESYNPIPTPPYDRRDAFTSGTNSDNGADIFTLSARGVVDNRVKPDLVAPATAMETPGTRQPLCPPLVGHQVGWNIDPTATAPHVWDRGTSFASPNAVGNAALLSTWYRNNNFGAAPSPAMIKAMQINFAYDLPTRPRAPELQQGWGKVDATRAFKTDGRYKWVDQSTVLTPANSIVWFPSLTSWYNFKDTSRPVRITLVWTDRFAANGANPALVNDLNLIVSSPFTGRTAVGNSFNATTGRSNTYYNQTLPYDHRNNVEQVVLNSADLGSSFVIEIWGETITGDAINVWNGSTPQQDFALFIENAYQ